MDILDKELQTIKIIVGDSITKENLLFVDSFISDKLCIFMPVGGNCGYAISPKHTHPSYMFVLAYDNETTVYVQEKKFETSSNTLFCLSPEVEHQEVQNHIPPKYCAIFIDKYFFEEQLRIYTEKSIFFDSLVVDLSRSKLDSLIKDFIVESLNQHLSKEILLSNISTLIAHEIIRNIVNYEIQKFNNSDNIIINEAIKFINTHYEREIVVDDLARLSKISKSHFTKLFSQNMRISPMEYLKEVRLQNAKKMLLSNKLSVTKVSQQCGFNSPSYFTKSFKERFFQTPKEYTSRVK